MVRTTKTKTDKNDHLIHKNDILHRHSGSEFSEREVNIVLIIILAIILLLFWLPLAEVTTPLQYP